MRICFVADAADIHTQRWAGYFANKGDDVHVISFDKPSEDMENSTLHVLRTVGIKTTILKYTINPLYVLKQLKKLIKEIKPDIIHGHAVRDHTIIAALTGFHPFVVTAWGSDVLIYPKESKVMKYAVPFTLRRADVITCEGKNTKEVMIKMGIKSEKINIIMHGVDIKKFNFSSGYKKLREELKTFNSPTVISTRRLGRIHDVETFINAIPLVLKKIPDAKFIIAGDGEQKGYLMARSKSLNVFDATRFIGRIPHDELPKYLSSSDVYVSTSLSDEGISISTQEAMVCELAAVITDVADNKRWIKDGENGFIVPAKDSKTLAEKIIYLLENEDIRKRFGKVSRRIIKEKADYYKEMLKMEYIYIKLVKRYKS